MRQSTASGRYNNGIVYSVPDWPFVVRELCEHALDEMLGTRKVYHRGLRATALAEWFYRQLSELRLAASTLSELNECFQAAELLDKEWSRQEYLAVRGSLACT